MLSSLTTLQIRWIFIDMILLLMSVALHEFGHAIVADRLGDRTPRSLGRVTLNPLAHADPIGTLVLPLASGIYLAMMYGVVGGGGFGWGKPVEWLPHRITRKISMAVGRVLVSMAGPGMNLILGTVLAIVQVTLLHTGAIAYGEPLQVNASNILSAGIQLNFILLFFNLIPVPPLDGRSLVEWVLPTLYREQYDQVAKYGMFIVLAFVAIPELQKTYVVPARFCVTHLYSLLHAIIGN